MVPGTANPAAQSWTALVAASCSESASHPSSTTNAGGLSSVEGPTPKTATAIRSRTTSLTKAATNATRLNPERPTDVRWPLACAAHHGRQSLSASAPAIRVDHSDPGWVMPPVIADARLRVWSFGELCSLTPSATGPTTQQVGRRCADDAGRRRRSASGRDRGAKTTSLTRAVCSDPRPRSSSRAPESSRGTWAWACACACGRARRRERSSGRPSNPPEDTRAAPKSVWIRGSSQNFGGSLGAGNLGASHDLAQISVYVALSEPVSAWRRIRDSKMGLGEDAYPGQPHQSASD